MKKTMVLINTGSSSDPCKAFFVNAEKYLESDNYTLSDEDVLIPINYEGYPNASYKENGEFMAERIYELILSQNVEIEFAYCRTAAFNYNVLGPTLITEQTILDLTPEESKKLAPGLSISHGSEAATWAAWHLGNKLGCKAYFSRGIPTDTSPLVIKMTGIPGVLFKPVSHYESIEGLADMISKEQNIPKESVKFILVMLGSGFGVYAWMNGTIVFIGVRHTGPVSQSSIGNIDVMTFINYEKDVGNSDIDSIITDAANLFGKTGGLMLLNKSYSELKNFANDVDEAMKNPDDPKNKEILDWFNMELYQLLCSIGKARGAMQYFGEKDSSQIPIYGFGGGFNWDFLAGSIETLANTKLLKIKGNPEMSFFRSQMLNILNGCEILAHRAGN